MSVRWGWGDSELGAPGEKNERPNQDYGSGKGGEKKSLRCVDLGFTNVLRGERGGERRRRGRR